MLAHFVEFRRRTLRRRGGGVSLPSLRNGRRVPDRTHYLREWHQETPYAKPTDFVFPSISGRSPICAYSAAFTRDQRRRKPGLSSRTGILGFAQPSTQPVELAGEQSEGEPEDGAGHLGSFANSDHARPLHRRRLRRDDRGSRKVLGVVEFEAGSVQ